MPNSRPRARSTDYGPRGAGQLDERVRVQRVKTKTSNRSPDEVWEDIVPGGTTETIASSTRFASVTARAVANEETAQFQTTSKGTRKEYDVRLRHIPEVTAEHRFLWRGIILNISSVDHQTERRSGGGYSNFVCVSAGNAHEETIDGGTTVGGSPEPNSSGEIVNLPIA